MEMGKIKNHLFVLKKMFKQSIIPILLCFSFLIGCSQHSETKSIDYFELIRPEFTGKLAYKTTDFVEDYWRVVGNTGFNNTIYLIADTLKAAGYVLEEKASPSDRLTYRIEKREMTHQTWEPVSASLQIIGESEPLLHSISNRNMTYLNSASTSKNGVEAEIVHIKSIDELNKVSVNGKVVFTELNTRKIFGQVLKSGAIGIITYDNPDYLQPEKNKTSIQFRSLPSQDSTNFWGIALSYSAKEKLTNQLQKGKTKVLVKIQTKRYPSEELTIIANIKGDKNPEERLVFSAHIQEPGANDNATGVGVQLEISKTVAKLFTEQKIELNRTMTFLWGDEIISTRRYIQEDKKRANGIKWGISLDMVGENTNITGGSFLIEKMPDPSAIWTRGKDKHTEWGGETLSLEDMKPHYLNDFIYTNFKKQGDFANWRVETNPFEGGSDHTPFLQANIPGLLLWHFTDQFYHTDNDRIDKVSQETLKNVGTAALVSGLQLVNSNEFKAIKVLTQLEKEATERLTIEFNLSKKVVQNNGDLKHEISILDAWEDWYLKSFSTTMDMVLNSDVRLKKEIKKAQETLAKTKQQFVKKLRE